MNKFMLFLLILGLAACDGKGGSSSSSSSSSSTSSSSSGSPLPVITLLGSYSVGENAPFSLPISVTGAGPFKYQIVYSADAALFSVNETTGELTSKSPFDYENPKSEKGTNQYSLSLLVTDSNKRSVTHDIVINVQDVNEHELVVDFPIDGANMGAAANKVHVRGHITDNGKKLTQIPAALTVEVNGIVAKVDPARPSMWLVEVPLPEPVNTLAVRLKNDVKVQREKTLVLSNNPVVVARVADGINDFTVETDLSGGKIYKRSLSDPNNYSLILSSSYKGFESCVLFNRLSLSKTSKQFAAYCTPPGQETAAVVYCNLADKTCRKVDQTITTYIRTIKWADDRFLIFAKSETEMGLLDTLTGVIKTVSFQADYRFNYQSFVDADQDQIYLILDKLQNGAVSPSYYTLPLKSLTESAELQQTVNPISMPVGSSFKWGLFSFNGHFYSPATGGMNVINQADGSVSFLRLDKFPVEQDLPALLHSANGLLVFEQDGSLITYEIATNLTKILESKKYLVGRFENDLSPDNKRLALFESAERKFSFYDLEAGAALNYDATNMPANENGNTFGSIAVDWQSKLIYRSLTLDWGGVAPSSSTAVIVAYDTVTKAYKTVLTSYQLANRINRPFDRVSPRRIVYKAATSELLFHAASYNGLVSEQFICSLNVKTGNIKILAEFPLTNQSGAVDFAEIFMGRLNPALNGIAFAHWGDLDDKGGGVEWYGFDGSLTNLLLPQQPYYLTSRGVMSPTGDRYYGAGFIRPAGPTTVNTSKGELFYIDMATKNRTVIASESQGLGLTPTWLEPAYDTNRDLLVDFSGRYLWFIDTVTGDRVVKPIELPAGIQ